MRRPRDRRAYVRGLHRLRGRRDIQSGREVAVDVRRDTQDADNHPRFGRLKVRSAAFSGLDGAHGAYPGSEGRLPRLSV